MRCLFCYLPAHRLTSRGTVNIIRSVASTAAGGCSMENKPIQIYLTEQQYSALRESAARYGKPMTAVVRDLIQTHLVEDAPPPTDISDLVGSVHWGCPTDVARDKDRMIQQAILEQFDRHS
jgi:hypothetical protein